MFIRPVHGGGKMDHEGRRGPGQGLPRPVGWLMAAVLGASLVGNAVLLYERYERTRVLSIETAAYDRFLRMRNEATQSADKALQDADRMSKADDVERANADISEATGILFGWRGEAARHGMDVLPVCLAMMSIVMPDPRDPSSPPDRQLQEAILRADRTLHHLQNALKGTRYANGDALEKLRAAILRLDAEYPGFPSYGRLQ